MLKAGDLVPFKFYAASLESCMLIQVRPRANFIAVLTLQRKGSSNSCMSLFKSFAKEGGSLGFRI